MPPGGDASFKIRDYGFAQDSVDEEHVDRNFACIVQKRFQAIRRVRDGKDRPEEENQESQSGKGGKVPKKLEEVTQNKDGQTQDGEKRTLDLGNADITALCKIDPQGVQGRRRERP